MYSDKWSSKFVKDKLIKFESLKSVNVINENLLQIKRIKGESFLTFTMSLDVIEFTDINEIIELTDNVTFITNVKKEYRISGSALNLLEEKKISFGGLSDLMRFANQENNSVYKDKEFVFVERGLLQHDKVISIERLDNKRLAISRIFLEDVIVVMNNDYDLGAESVRSYKDRFNLFKVIISTNPNSRISSEAYSVAGHLNIDICKWGDFLGKLNTFWN